MPRQSKRKDAEERRQKRVRVVMAIFVSALFILSSFAFVLLYYAPQNPDQAQASRFTVRDGLLYTTVGGQEAHFYSYPEVGIVVPQEATDLLHGADAAVFLFDPTRDDLIYIETVRWDLSTYLDVPMGSAVTEPSEEYSLPVASCEVATPAQPFITVRNDTVAQILVEGSCIVLAGEQQDLLLLRDQLLYAYYGVR